MIPKIKAEKQKILECLAQSRENQEDFLWAREIAKRTGIKVGNVVWIINRYLYPKYIDYPEASELITKGLRIRPIRLKDDILSSV